MNERHEQPQCIAKDREKGIWIDDIARQQNARYHVARVDAIAHNQLHSVSTRTRRIAARIVQASLKARGYQSASASASACMHDCGDGAENPDAEGWWSNVGSQHEKKELPIKWTRSTIHVTAIN